jgi:hypothetical protein
MLWSASQQPHISANRGIALLPEKRNFIGGRLGLRAITNTRRICYFAKTVLESVVLALVIISAVMLFPDFVRYMKIRSM